MTEASVSEARSRIGLLDRLISVTVLRILPSSVTPNHITLFRFLTIPFIMALFYLELYGWGLLLFAVSALTDAIDGALARTTNQITDWGRLYDPLADKLLIGSAAVLLIVQELGWKLAVAVIAVELLLIANAAYIKKVHGKTLEAVLAGKLKMLLQCAAVIFILVSLLFENAIFLDAARTSLYIAIPLGLISLLIYRSI